VKVEAGEGGHGGSGERDLEDGILIGMIPPLQADLYDDVKGVGL